MAGGDQNDKPQKENRWKRRKVAAAAPSAYASDLLSPFANRKPKASPSAGPSVSPFPGGTMSGNGAGAPGADDPGAPLTSSIPVPPYPSMTGAAHGSDRLRSSGTHSGGRDER